MKTDMNAFCGQFSSELKPFVDGVRDALGEMPTRGDVEEIDVAVDSLRDVEHRLAGLWDKIDGQRTLLLIFGPLKSGKSTLMNALGGTYVSEVSSLPAYPALVYVKDGPEQRFQATDYAGKRREFPDNIALAEAVEKDHFRLAEALLEAESRGETFEPEQHCPDAIYRMEIEIPAANLAESGSVLVDTPGLYSRMRFGYDQMTRDFRDTASCAIFVVKTDNLFFEKVFEEFEELLESFSRVFLVSNIDSSKKDLRPDGSLEASLESRDPDKIVDAFRSLSMSPSVRGAIEDGRLKIYPIDLLQAASRTLRGVAATAQDDVDSLESRDDGFDEFVADLTGYLNSADYLHDFVNDTLRQAEDLASETTRLVSTQAATEVERNLQQAKEELKQAKSRRDALDALGREDWSEAFQPLRDASDRILAELEEQGDEELEGACEAALRVWMESDESWNQLIQIGLQPQFDLASRRQAGLVLERLREVLLGSDAGAEFSEMQLQRLRTAGVPWEDVLAVAVDDFGASVKPDVLSLSVSTDEIPVTRSMGGMRMFRSRSKIREEVFGDDGNAKLDSFLKNKRLGGEGLETLRARLKTCGESELPALRRRYADELVAAHVRRCTEALTRLFTEETGQQQQAITETEQRMVLREQVLASLERIKASAARLDGELGGLRMEYQPQAASVEGIHTA